MGRLSVSLDDDQETWITDRSQELGISKGKVIRECIDDIRTGESLFTESVSSGESSYSGRISSLEEQLAALEETVQNEIRSADATTTPGESRDLHPTTDDRAPQQGDALDTNHSAPLEDRSGQEADKSQQDQATSTESTGATPSRASNDPERSSPKPSTPSNATSFGTGPRMPDSSTDTADASTTQSDTDEFDVPDIDTADANRIRSALESSLASDAHATAVVSCWQHINDRGTAHVRSLKSHFEEYPLGHDTEDTWWAEEIKPVLEVLPGIDPPKGSGSFYRFKY